MGHVWRAWCWVFGGRAVRWFWEAEDGVWDMVGLGFGSSRLG